MGYTPSFTPQYENGWEDLPIEETPITAEALNAYDDAIENIEGYLASDESQANLADAYDETATYEEGDYVIYGGDLYKCLEDIDEPEEWDSTKWESCLITNEMGHGGGGSNVSITPTLSTGTKIADFEIDGESGELYAPTGGGGNANIWTGTQAELEEVFDELEEGTQINITDDEQEVVEGGTIYSEEEQIIGLWKDNRPIYQKSYVLTSSISVTSAWTNTGITLPSEVDRIINGEVYRNTSTGLFSASFNIDTSNHALRIRFASSETLDANSIITIQYTKSTDAPLDVVVGKKTMYIASSDCYSTEEKEIGCWTDGKPLYQKSFIFTSGWSLGSWSTIADLSSLNIENFISAQGRLSRGNLNLQLPFEGSIYPESSNNYKVSFRYYAGNLETLVMVYNDIDSLAVTIRYTKTTDTAGGGSYTPASGKAVHYSTDEQVIGTWIDGSTLYRKVYAFNENVTISMTSWTNVNSYISNIGFSTFVRCYGIDANGTYQGEILCGLDANNQLQMLSPRNGNASIAVTKIILEYTKTTD